MKQKKLKLQKPNKLGSYTLQASVIWESAFVGTEAFHDLMKAYSKILQIPIIAREIKKEHIERTPYRVVKALSELLNGYKADPKVILKTNFNAGQYNEMITVGDVGFVSLCAHHLLPFLGKCYFAYIPNNRIVGLSKIPRLIEAFSHRLQVQETLSEQIVDCFQEVVKPRGCAITIEASHMCMSIRGVRKEGAYMRTTALRGIFQKDESAKAEFLASIGKKL